MHCCDAVRKVGGKESAMIEVKVLGTGCGRCQTTARVIAEVARERGIAINLEKVEDLQEIARYGVLSTPAVLVNGKVAVAGVVPDRASIVQWLTAAAPAH
jgi:small redox-active disulfide protein 2